MLKKLIIVYNPRASRHADIQREVLTPARQLSGWLVGKYELKPTDVDDNAANLAKLINDGDLVVAVGGDGTAAVTVNGILLSEKQAAFSALGYGNFNDVAALLRTRRPVEYGGEYVGGIIDIVRKFETEQTVEIYPLEAKVNGEHWRYALTYITLGMMAESVEIFQGGKVRKHLKSGKVWWPYSILQLVKWYFTHRQEEFLPAGMSITQASAGPEIIIDGATPEARASAPTTDYIAINAPRMAKYMRGSKKLALRPKEFRSGTLSGAKLLPLLWFMFRSLCFRVPGHKTTGDSVKFPTPSQITLHAEGEYAQKSEVKTVEITKVAQPLKVVKF